MIIIYNILIFLFWFCVHLFYPFSKKARLWVNGRKNWKEKLQNKIDNNNKWIWFHCASLGEFEDGRTIIESIKIRYSQVKIILTFSSPSGYENLKKYDYADHIMYMPFDFKKNVSNFISILEPVAIFFIRSEIWINYTNEIKKRDIPFYLVSLNLNHSSNFFKLPLKNLYINAFRSFEMIFCQNERTASILTLAGIKNITITGNTRIDRIKNVVEIKYENEKIKDFIGESYCIIAGSTSLSEEKIIYKAIKKMEKYPIKWIIAPHVIDHKKINNRVKQNPQTITSLSNEGDFKNHKILYIDCIGILSRIYRYSDLAIIGGGFCKKGIHSIIEPALYGIPVTFGPNHRNYDEAIEMILNNHAVIFNNSNELTVNIEKFYQKKNDIPFRNEIKEYISKKSGATNNICSQLNDKLELILK